MDSLMDIPVFRNGDLTAGQTELKVHALGQAATPEQAWEWLPSKGQGVVVLADRVQRFQAGPAPHLFLDAEVTDGQTTVVVRASGERWLGWRWEETPGNSHRYVDHKFVSSEHPNQKGLHLYRQYWKREEDDGLQVWHPLGARFLGFQEDGQ